MWYLPLYILTSASPSGVTQIRLFVGLLLTIKSALLSTFTSRSTKLLRQVDLLLSMGVANISAQFVEMAKT